MASPSTIPALLKQRIAAQGPLSVAEFMRVALSEPGHGYYATRDPLGAAGDFVTAPEISQLFGEMLGLWCVDVWEKLGRPEPFLLAELGPLPAEAVAAVEEARRVYAEGIERVLAQYPPIGSLLLSGHAHIDLAWLWPLAENLRWHAHHHHRREPRLSGADVRELPARPGHQFASVRAHSREGRSELRHRLGAGPEPR